MSEKGREGASVQLSDTPKSGPLSSSLQGMNSTIEPKKLGGKK